ncbi:MAG: TIGR01212 family radical SAM protein [Desulfobacteraceae bacterium IS3]|nr:MAG: TIGR01212 family radical SAM protein [Desulfobacteraceae bacterium IS3]
MNKRYNDLNTYLRNLFGCRVQKITVDAGLSCPNRDGSLSFGGCIYCNAKGSGTGAHTHGLSVSEQLIRGKEALSRRYKAKKFIAYFQSFSNTYSSLEKLRSLYDEALAVEDVAGLSIGTRPDCVNEAILQLLESYAKDRLIWIEYGLQSAHDATLAFINRGHNLQCFKDAVNATKNRGINICVHLILGLPGETKAQMLETANIVADMGLDGVKLHLLYVIKGTVLEKLYQHGDYNCMEQLEYIDIVCDVLERLPGEMIIQRLTGDPHKEELVAPLWSLRKRETLDLIAHTMEMRNSFQGKFFLPRMNTNDKHK